MPTLMLDPRFKSFDVAKAIFGWAKVIQIMGSYDNKSITIVGGCFSFPKPHH
jgi:hypothetical protein